MQVGWEEILSFFIFLSSHRLDSSEKRVLLNRFQELLNRRDGGISIVLVDGNGGILNNVFFKLCVCFYFSLSNTFYFSCRERNKLQFNQ